MFWGKSRERQFAVNDDETKEIRPKTAPQPKTLKQRKVIDGDAHTKQKSLKLFKKRRKNGNISIFAGSVNVNKKTRPKTVASTRKTDVIVQKRLDSPSVNESYNQQKLQLQDYIEQQNILQLDEEVFFDRGKLYPTNLAIYSYRISEENDEYFGYGKDHIIGQSVKKIDLTHWDATDATIRLLSRMAPNLTNFVSPGCYSLTNHGFNDLFTLNKFLNHVDISGCILVTDDSIFTLTENNVNLQYLDFSSCSKITDDSLRAIAEHLLQIETLYAASCPLLTNRGIINLSEGTCCKTLKDMDLSNCVLLSDYGLRELVNKSPTLSQLKCYGNELIDGTMFSVPIPGQVMECNLFISCQVNSFVLQGCHLIDDERITWLAQSCMHLKSLDISNCPKVSSVGISTLCEKCTNLEALNVIGCGDIIDYAVSSMTQNCRGMRAIDLAGHYLLTDASISFILSNCLSLNYLNLSGLTQLTDTTFVPAAEIEQEMDLVKNSRAVKKYVRAELTSLHMADMSYISDASLGAIGILFNKLKVIDLSNCSMITNLGVAKLCKFCNRLKNANFSFCQRLTHRAVSYITKYCKSLETLKLSARKKTASAMKMSDKSLNLIFSRLEKLKVLEVKNRQNVSANKVKKVNATDLRAANFSGCIKLRAKGLVKIILACKKLENLDVTNCKNITKKFVIEVYRLRQPYCKISKNYRGIESVPNATLMKHQYAYSKRKRLENDSAAMLQKRWRGWLQGEFTLMYLFRWTKNLKRKGEVDTLATLIQKIYRGKLGRRRAYTQMLHMKAIVIQNWIRRVMDRIHSTIRNIRNISARIIQSAWKLYLYKSVSLVARVKALVAENKRREEIRRKRMEKIYYSARTLQMAYRCYVSRVILSRRKAQRHHAIFSTALITPARQLNFIEMDAPDRRFFFRSSDGMKRYPSRFCYNCNNAHATVICFGCGFDLCPKCDHKLHVLNPKFKHHPERVALRVKLPENPSFDPPLHNSFEIRKDWYDIVYLIIRVQNRRYAVLAELKMVVSAMLEKRRLVELERKKKEDQKRLDCIVTFQAAVRRFFAKQNFPDLIDQKKKGKKHRYEKLKMDSATKIQALYRGYSIRIWAVNLPMEDPRRMWHEILKRKLIFLPSKIIQMQKQATNLRYSFATTLKPSNAKYRLKQRLWENFRRNAGRKCEKYRTEMHKHVQQVKKFEKYKDVHGSVLRRTWERAKIALLKSENLLDAKTSQIMVTKVNDQFLENRIGRELRRDAISTAEGLAIHNAMQVLEVEKNNLYIVFDKILDLESIGDEDVEHSDTDVHHDSSSEEEIDDEDLGEHEIQAIKQQIALKKKEKVGRKIKEQIARRKQRERRHERLIKYRTHWLTKQKYKVGKMILDVEEERYKLTLHGLNSAMKELELYKAYNDNFAKIMTSVRLQIQLLAEDSWLKIASKSSELMEGEGAKIHFEALTKSMRVQKRISDEKGFVMDLTGEISELSADQVLRREKFVVCDWMAAKKKWKANVRQDRFFENKFDVKDWLALYEEAPWSASLGSDAIEPKILKVQNERFEKAIDLARKKQGIRDEENRIAKEIQDKKDAIAQAKLDKKQKEQADMVNNYGEVLAELLTEMSEELRNKKEADRRANKTRFERLKEDVNMFFNGAQIREEQEMKRIKASIRNKQRGNLGYIEGIEQIQIRWGKENNKEFQELQDEFAEQEYPYYRRVSKKIDQLVLWYLPTIDNDMMITDIRISHAKDGSFYNHTEENIKVGYNMVRDEDEKCELVFWYKRVREDLPVSDFDVSFTIQEEEALSDKNFTKLKMDLGYAQLPSSCYIWQKKFKSRINRPEKEISEDFVLKQIKGYKEIVDQDENNIKAAKKLKKLEKQLREVRAKKLKKDKNKLKSMVEFLAMEEQDVLSLMAIFKEMDEDDSGEVSLTEFFDYIDVDRSVFGDKMFQFLDEDNDGQLDFPEFVNAVGTYNMFGVTEWLQFAFGMFDKDGNGYIMEPELKELLVTIHGDDPLHTGGVDRVMDVFDRNGDGKVEWAEFESVNKRYASMFMPIFTIQKSMQRSFLGARYWNRKKQLFFRVREDMKNVRVRNAKLLKNRRIAEKMRAERAAELARIAEMQEDAGVEVTATAAGAANLGDGVPFITSAQRAKAAYNPKKVLKKLDEANEELKKVKEAERFKESRKGFNERANKRKEERIQKRNEMLKKKGKLTRRVKHTVDT